LPDSSFPESSCNANLLFPFLVEKISFILAKLFIPNFPKFAPL